MLIYWSHLLMPLFRFYEMPSITSILLFHCLLSFHFLLKEFLTLSLYLSLFQQPAPKNVFSLPSHYSINLSMWLSYHTCHPRYLIEKFFSSRAKVFRSFLNQSYYHRWGKELSSDGMDLLWSTTVSIFAIGGMLGGLGGSIADLCGR